MQRGCGGRGQGLSPRDAAGRSLLATPAGQAPAALLAAGPRARRGEDALDPVTAADQGRGGDHNARFRELTMWRIG